MKGVYSMDINELALTAKHIKRLNEEGAIAFYGWRNPEVQIREDEFLKLAKGKAISTEEGINTRRYYFNEYGVEFFTLVDKENGYEEMLHA